MSGIYKGVSMVNSLKLLLIPHYIAWIKGQHYVSEVVYVVVFTQVRLARQDSVLSSYRTIDIGRTFVFSKEFQKKFRTTMNACQWTVALLCCITMTKQGRIGWAGAFCMDRKIRHTERYTENLKETQAYQLATVA
jgi:hypothetical protein